VKGKTFYIDLTKCTACRGCQVACKQWKKLPAEQTRNVGSHQNPQDLSAVTLKLVRFTEVEVGKALQWLFFPEQCRHCVNAFCYEAAGAESQDAIIHDQETGAVVFTPKTAELDYDMIRGACPYDIPRMDPATKIMTKCDMCLDRVQNGLKPSCVKTCPTGAMNFGDREDMLKLAEQGLAKAKARYPQAMLVNVEDVRVVYLAPFDPKLYHKTMMADIGPRTFTRGSLLAQMLRPARAMFG
jgi:formate dehydrogenase iron-sulfur subunit